MMMIIGAMGFRFVRGIIKSAVLSSDESPWEFWQRSMSKTDIVCMYDKGNDVLLILGEIKLVRILMIMIMMMIVNDHYGIMIKTLMIVVLSSYSSNNNDYNHHNNISYHIISSTFKIIGFECTM